MKNRFLLLLFLLVSIPCLSITAQSTVDKRWWRETRFGMFVHWGLYSVAGGQWNGQEIPGIGEWIQNFAGIPNIEYEKLVHGLTLENYNPQEWVKMAKDAGAGYIVFTTKHHEGFAMYKSKVSDFNIQRTPYKGDPLRELIDECRKQGVKVGLYYSHRQDWREEDAAILKRDFDGHFGKPKSKLKPDLDRYIKEKAIPQVKELLTDYGRIDVLWFDTPFELSKEQSKQFVDIVHELQPNCIINGRVGYNLGDYGPLGDNEMPCGKVTMDLEMVATMNHTWGYKRNDHEWKSARDILCSLIECSSRGVNYMVNVGPRPDGTIPEASIKIMDYIGKWMDRNAESIKGTSNNPFNDNFPWGYVTRKDNVLYLHLIHKPLNGVINLKGILSPITKVSILGENVSLNYENGEVGKIIVPKDLDYESIPVLKVACQSPARFSDENVMNENVISVPVSSGKIIPGEEGCLTFLPGCVTENFAKGKGSVKMSFIVEELGTYAVRIYTSRHWRKTFAKGARVNLKVMDNEPFKDVELKQDCELDNVRRNSYPESWSEIGEVQFNKKGLKTMELSVNATGVHARHNNVGEDTQGESDNNIRFMRIELVKR